MIKTNTKPRKTQADRLLKQLSLQERRQQEALRTLIAGDPFFKSA